MDGGGIPQFPTGTLTVRFAAPRVTLLYATACTVYVCRGRSVALTCDAVGRRWPYLRHVHVVGWWWQARDQRNRRNMAAKMQPPFEPPSSASSERCAGIVFFSLPLIVSHIFSRWKSMNILFFSVTTVTCAWTTVRSFSPTSCARMPSITDTPTSARRNRRGHRPQVDSFIVDSV